MKNFTQKFIGLLALVFAMSFTVNSQEIGNVYEGGYIFQINEDFTGLVADLQDLGEMDWYDAMDEADNATSGGYNDWYLPSIEELELMYNTIGNGGPEGDIGGFSDNWYWCSSEYGNNGAWNVSFDNGFTGYPSYETSTYGVRVIRSVTFDTEVSGCTDSSANNYNVEATVDDESCTYAPVILLTPPPIEFTNGETLPLVSSQDLWDFGAIYDADNSLEELTITLSVNPDEINLVWDGGINSNPTLSAVSDFSGNTEIELCISDDESTVCGANIIIVYEGSPTEEETTTTESFLDLPEGWSMFGYTCMDSLDAVAGFSEIADKIEIVKDEWGLAYIIEWGFNGLGSLQFSEGYQIKMIEEVTDFQFCDAITQEDVDAAVAEVSESYAGWIAPVYGCTGPDHCNYNALANTDDGSCFYAQAGYDCDGNVLPQIGDEHAGGIVFQINEDGTGLVADPQDLGEMNWYDAMDVAASATSQSYNDWYLPSKEELELMYNTIGNGGPEGDIGGFYYDYYWSSSEFGYNDAWLVYFYDGDSYGISKDYAYGVCIIRAF